MKQIKDITVIQFVYESKEECDKHISELESRGWRCTGRVNRSKNTKPLVSIHDAHDNDSREYFAELWMDNLIRD